MRITMNTWLRHVVHAVLMLGCSVAAAADDAEGAAALGAVLGPTLDFALPSDAQLQSRSARIGNVDILIDEVFDQGSHLAAPYRLANGLHVDTRQATIQQQLLFRPGDVFDRRVLDETERLLREQRYLGAASIEVVRYNPDNTVDVRVRVHDVWTLSPGLSFGRKGGANSSKFKLEDTNFLGTGKQLSLARSQDADRSGVRLGYADPHLLGSWWRLSAAHSTLSDGSDDELSIGRPFFSLDSRWSAGLSVSSSQTRQSVYSLGDAVASVDVDEHSYSLDGGLSAGLQNGWAKRVLFGVRDQSRSFAPVPNPTDALLPEDRRFVYPYVGLQWIEDGYVATRNLNQIGRTEDLHLGRSLELTAGWAAGALGSTRDALLLQGTAGTGHDFGRGRYLTATAGWNARVESDGLHAATFDMGARYYLRESEHRVLFVGADATFGSRLDPEQQVLLGGDNGLRGYPLRYQAGTARTILTVEQRFYTDWQPFKLVNVGAALFADTGRTWGVDARGAAPQGWLSDVGVGLRLGGISSGAGNVLHIDLAFPLNRSTGIDGMQLVIGTKRSF